MKTELRAIISYAFIMFCLLIAPVSGEVKVQDKSANSNDNGIVYTQKEVDEKAVVDSGSKVNNAPSAQGCKGSGSVLLRVVLHSSGKVTDVEVRKASDCKKFQERAVKAVRKVTFKPARKGGTPVSQYAMFEYNYHVW